MDASKTGFVAFPVYIIIMYTYALDNNIIFICVDKYTSHISIITCALMTCPFIELQSLGLYTCDKRRLPARILYIKYNQWQRSAIFTGMTEHTF